MVYGVCVWCAVILGYVLYDKWCMNDVRCVDVCGGWRVVYGVLCMVCSMRCVRNGVWCMVCGMRCVRNGVKLLQMTRALLRRDRRRNRVYGVWCMVYGVWCVVVVWCMVQHGAWCNVWCMVYGVWCMVYGVWCMVYGVWCMVYDEDDIRVGMCITQQKTQSWLHTHSYSIYHT